MKSRLLVVLVTTLTLAACGTDKSPTVASSAPPAAAASGRPSQPATEGCDSPGPAATVTGKDNGSVVCLTAGGVLTVTLGSGWKTPTVDGTVLKAAGTGKFTAAVEGKTTLSSSRKVCPSASAGAVSCGAIQAFQVRVVVS